MGGELIIAAQGMVIMSPIIGVVGLIGLLLNPFVSKFKLISIYFFLSFVNVLIFCLFFYVVEGRYLLFTVPILILSFAIFVDRLWMYFKNTGRHYLIYLTVTILLISVLISQVPPVYRQLAEKASPIIDDRNYPVINMVNSYVKNLNETKNIAVISIIPPYIFDYYARPNYKLLPLSLKQTFMGTPKITWGEGDYSDLIVLYKKYINSGYSLYLAFFKVETPWSLGTVERYVYYRDFNKISQNFNLEKITDGCEGGCSLYKINLQ